MDERAQKIEAFERKIAELSRQQETYTLQLAKLQRELAELKKDDGQTAESKPSAETPNEATPQGSKPAASPKVSPSVPKFQWEKFIGENLMNKVGILILLIGAFIGAKYAIENQMLSPVIRIIGSYILSLSLLGFALKLRLKYKTYSAVLLSGSLAIAYFATYAAFVHYQLLSKYSAFGIMVLITMLTVIAANQYRQQIIALIGMVGAYAIPFLLSDGSGQVAVLLSYILLINLGLLIISLKNYWKAVLYSSLIITWLIVLFWFVDSYDGTEQFQLAMLFTTLYFLSFYALILLFKTRHQQNFARRDISLLLINSFTAFSLGYAFISDQEFDLNYLGFYTLIHALVHLAVYLFFYFRYKIDESFALLILGLSLAFGTLAIPIQLDGNWVNSIWIFEAAVLFYIGRSKKLGIYEGFAYPLAVLAFFALLASYNSQYLTYSSQSLIEAKTPIINLQFFSSLLFIGAVTFMVYWSLKTAHEKSDKNSWMQKSWTSWFFPTLLLLVSFLSLRYEINNFWYQKYQILQNQGLDSAAAGLLEIKPELSFYLKKCSQLAYAILFFCLLYFANERFFQQKKINLIGTVLINLSLLGFLVEGLSSLQSILSIRLETDSAAAWPFWIRYLFYPLLALAWYYLMKNREREVVKKYAKAQEIFFHFFLLCILSSDLIHWDSILASDSQNLWTLSLLWGLYALGLVLWGIIKSKGYLRLAAILLFSVTLIKLFFVDLSDLNNLSKTLVFISLGILLLIISFLYHKFKPTDQSLDKPDNT